MAHKFSYLLSKNHLLFSKVIETSQKCKFCLNQQMYCYRLMLLWPVRYWSFSKVHWLSRPGLGSAQSNFLNGLYLSNKLDWRCFSCLCRSRTGRSVRRRSHLVLRCRRRVLAYERSSRRRSSRSASPPVSALTRRPALLIPVSVYKSVIC